MSTTYEVDNDVHVIEFDMLDKQKYYPLVAVNGFVVRGILYPVSLIRTRLQIQKNDALYKGTFDAFRKIFKSEGARGLYKGFWISNLLVVSQMSYITTYEYVRSSLATTKYSLFSNDKVRSFIAGGCASMVGQTFLVPVDIVSQHLQMLGTNTCTLNIPRSCVNTRVDAALEITKAVYRSYGLTGFYKGYLASLAVYAPNSAMWWFSYGAYCNAVASVAPIWIPRLVVQCIAGPLSGATCATLFTPLDAIRARVQVENTEFMATARQLWQEERFGILTKGLSARLIQSCLFSFWIVLFYESIKRLSIRSEYKHQVKW